MKKKYLSIAKKLGWNVISYNSYWSDMSCRCVDIMLEKDGHIISDDFGYWCNDYNKSLVLSQFQDKLKEYIAKWNLNDCLKDELNNINNK